MTGSHPPASIALLSRLASAPFQCRGRLRRGLRARVALTRCGHPRVRCRCWRILDLSHGPGFAYPPTCGQRDRAAGRPRRECRRSAAAPAQRRRARPSSACRTSGTSSDSNRALPLVSPAADRLGRRAGASASWKVVQRKRRAACDLTCAVAVLKLAFRLLLGVASWKSSTEASRNRARSGRAGAPAYEEAAAGAGAAVRRQEQATGFGRRAAPAADPHGVAFLDLLRIRRGLRFGHHAGRIKRAARSGLWAGHLGAARTIGQQRPVSHRRLTRSEHPEKD